jgi:hypothetical protein
VLIAFFVILTRTLKNRSSKHCINPRSTEFAFVMTSEDEKSLGLEQQQLADSLLRQGDLNAFVEALDDIEPQAWVLDAVLEYVIDEHELPEPVRRLFGRAGVETVFDSVASFLQTTVHVHSRDVVVVSPTMEVAVGLLRSKIDGPPCWGRILEVVDGNRVMRFLESTAALSPDDELYHGNVVPILTRRALDLEPAVRGSILDRLCSRGYAGLVVGTVLNIHRAAPIASLPGVLGCFPDASQGSRHFVAEALFQVAELYQAPEAPADRVGAMARLVPVVVYTSNLQVRLHLDMLLTRARLGARSVGLLVDYLDLVAGERLKVEGEVADDIDHRKEGARGQRIAEEALVAALERAVGVWGGPLAANRLSAYQQKVLASFIVRCLRTTRLTRADVEHRMGLVPAILKGIGVYLESPLPNVRKIGMCVGNALSSVLSPDSPQIFPDEGLHDAILLDAPEDIAQEKLDRNQGPAVKRVVVERRDARAPDSDDDTDSEFGYQENLPDLDQDDSDANYRLQEVVKMLGGNEDHWKEQLEAISVSEQIIRASPDELGLYVEPLAKGLMFTRLPAWAKDEGEVKNAGDGTVCSGSSSLSSLPLAAPSYEQKRMDALLALVLELPEAAGGCLIEAFYSPSANIEHRTKSLQLLSSGAKELALDSKGRVILQWSAKLLGQCDKPRHGVDMFGRDTYLLGCLLCTMGNFLEACAGTLDALYLGTATIKLVLSNTVRRSPEIFVRRSALAAAARAISSVPAASVCASVADDMLPEAGGGRASRGRVTTGTPTAREFSSLLVTAKGWFEEVLNGTDADDTCQKLAQGCLNYLQLLVIDALEEHARQLEDAGTDLTVEVPFDLLTQAPKIRVPESSDNGVIFAPGQ